WRILLEDVERVCKQLMSGEPVRLPAKTNSYQQWAEALVAYRDNPELQIEANYWLETVTQKVSPLPRDHCSGDDTTASGVGVVSELSENETRQLIRETPKAYRCELREVLVAALARTLCEWAGSTSVLIDLEGHGREEEIASIDLTRTVGWFTTIYPVCIPY